MVWILLVLLLVSLANLALQFMRLRMRSKSKESKAKVKSVGSSKGNSQLDKLVGKKARLSRDVVGSFSHLDEDGLVQTQGVMIASESALDQSALLNSSTSGNLQIN
uniref:Uncharacterized protein n=1 Tax=Strombidium rassoulzadegani TaxID=1082188 RepID=A0A7S3CJM7_9SPIT|mmetsp:Transcript_12895/g.21815  ORF Transcript_12895/g.21815 Transcript_12895/m.21815 type:complete len:106 (+) Transcript_12895:657-974(+)